MVDRNLNDVAKLPTQADSLLHQTNNNALQAEALASSNMSTGTKVARVGEVTVEGLAETPAGIVHSAENFIKPSNWGKDALMLGSSALMGVAFRTALPEAGAIKTAAGLIMGGLMVKDGVMPMAHAWHQVTTNNSDAAMHDAARSMGDGLGDFAVSGGLSIAAAGFAANKTPDLWNKFSPDTWGKIETFKNAHFGEQSTVSSALSAVHDRVSKGTQSLADTLDPKPKTFSDLSPSEQLDMVRQFNDRQRLAYIAENMHRNGMAGPDGRAHGVDETLDMLSKGIDPRSVRAATPEAVAKGAQPAPGSDLSNPGSIKVAGGEDAAPSGHKIKLERAVAPVDEGKMPPEGQPAAGQDPTAPNDMARLVNAKTMSAQAAAMKAALESVSDPQGLVIDGVNRTTGAVYVRTNPGVQPLKGYDLPAKAMYNLAGEVGSDPAGYMQVGPLFDRFGAAALQSGTAGASDVGDLVGRLNAKFSEDFETYKRNMLKHGIDLNVALQNKRVAPLAEATSDLMPGVLDSHGRPVHEGPHTVRAIYGPNGEPVWPIDLVKYPVREMGFRGTATSGIYDHEETHDQYGNTGKFDPTNRDANLGQAARAAAGADADKAIQIPNGGIDPQKVLLSNVLRQLPQVDAAQQEDFLYQALQRDPQSMMTKAISAADDVLGPGGREHAVMVNGQQVPLTAFVADLAAQADTRAPSEVLAEAQGHGDPEAARAQAEQNLAQRLGRNGQMKIPAADGTETTLQDAAMKVYDSTKLFNTYDVALPKTMTYEEVLSALAKATADEVFADWGAAANSGQTAAPYFQALSRDGLLRSSGVMEQDMRSEDNPLGLPVHAIDKLRPRYQAALIRLLATADGGKDQLLLDYADALDKYSRDASKPGDISFFSADAPGQAVTIPEPMMDKFITELAKQQMSAKLPRLQGHTLLDILPDLRKNFRTNLALADQWAEAIKKGQSPDSVPFDKSQTKINHVFGAGQFAFLKLAADGMDPVKANDAVNQFSDYFGNQYLSGNPHASTPFFKRLQIAPATTLKELPAMTRQPIANTLRMEPKTTDWLSRNAFGIAGGSAAYQVQDLLGLHDLKQNMLNGNGG